MRFSLPAHGEIIVTQTRSFDIARILPQAARMVDDCSENDGPGNGSDNSSDDPLDPEGEGPLVFLETPEWQLFRLTS